MVAGEPQEAVALGGARVGRDEGVEEGDGEGEHEHARPDDGDDGLDAAAAAVDVGGHRVDDGDVPGQKDTRTAVR